MSHPTQGELLELHFEELTVESRQACTSHVETCPACKKFLADLDSIEWALGLGPEEGPPADGLERVLARVGEVRPTHRLPGQHHTSRPPGQHQLAPLFPSLAAIAGGVAWILQSGVTGALTFFLGGALVTLALAPVLILESQRRTS